jgi:tripartite-type tricarboxylate transporter receptor subunit TctC
VLAPSGIADDLKAKLGRDCADAVNAPAVARRLQELGAVPVGSTPDEFAEFIQAEYEKWGPVIQAAGIKAE